jgi:hypothetical protein
MLLEHIHNKYSQFGEDGIIAYLFQLIGESTRSCLEVGAGDGVTNSNTRLLFENGWRSLQIENDGGVYEALVRNTQQYDNVKTVLAKVSSVNFSSMITENGFTTCDFMVIDVDGDDYHLWNSMVSACHPRVVMIEYNPTFPFNVEYIQKEGLRIGSSSYALWKLGRSKDYHLVCMTQTNCIFVDNYTFLLHKTELRYPYILLYSMGVMENYYPRDYDMHIYFDGPWDFTGKRLESVHQLNHMAHKNITHNKPSDLQEMLWQT